jgi:uncharacterized membrane protein YczE
VVILVGLGVMLLWIPLRERPGLGTISNAILIGVVVDLTLLWLTTPDALVARWALMLGGPSRSASGPASTSGRASARAHATAS